MNFKQRLLELINEKAEGSQKFLSDKTQIPPSTINCWITKDIKPTYVQIIKLADFFKISTDEILGRTSDYSNIIEIKGEDISKDEKELLTIYRSLGDVEKQTFLQTAQGLGNALNSNSVKKKTNY